MVEEQRRLLSLVRTEGIGSMTFLLKKVDENCFKMIDRENSSLIQVCLKICCEEGSRENVGTEILISELIKRILILHKEKDVSLHESLIQLVLDYCVLHWDSLVGAVSYNCVDIFSHILSNHTKFCDVCRLRNVCSVASNIIYKIVQSGSNSKARLKCIKLLLDSFNIVAEVNKGFVEEAYASLEYPNLSVAASELIEQDMCIKKNNYEFHLQQITSIFVKNSENSRSAVKDRLIPIILKSSNYPPTILLDIVSALIKNSLENPQNFEALLVIVHRLVYKPPVQEKTPTWLNFLKPKSAYQALLNPSSQVRVVLWSLITDHPKKTQPFTKLDFDLMKFFLTTNSAEQLPTVRQKILSGFRNVLERLCESGENHKLKHEDGSIILNSISDFIKFTINLAFDCISTEANFSRRLMGLYFIEFIFASKYLETKQKSKVLKHLELEKELTQDRFFKLLSNLDNEYQICQMTAMKLLRVLYPRENIDFDFKKYTEDTLVLINSVRTQDTLASGYRLQYSLINVSGADISLLTILLQRCELNLAKVKEKLMNITTYSLHSLLNAISYLLDERRNKIMEHDREFLDTYTSKLLKMCFEIAEIV
ncbi:unnamed protein product [Auanema sp. JU1783]|nr:unnamed protein product [Auanema sp. JU1783]CAI4226811.1 unnamed protein product [Auanema sp. JU1783]